MKISIFLYKLVGKLEYFSYIVYITQKTMDRLYKRYQYNISLNFNNMIPQFLVMKKDLVLSFNETTWELKFTETEQKVFEHGYPLETETRVYDVYEVFLNGKNYKNIKVKIHQDYLADDLRNVLIYKNDEYLCNTFFHSKDEVTLDAMIDITKWIKFHTEIR